MIETRFFETELPSYAVNYLANDDPSGLRESDIKNIDDFMKCLTAFPSHDGFKFSHIDYGYPDLPHFSTKPCFGEPCNCFYVKLVYSKEI